jgi:hypothetical protein
MRARAVAVLVFLVGVVSAGNVSAQVGADGSRADGSIARFELGVGAFASEFATSVRLDSETLGQGTTVDLEHDLGLASSLNSVRIESAYRFSRRHAIAFGYSSWSRTADRAITRDIQWGGQLFHVTGQVASSFKDDLVKLSYRYSFVATPGFAAGFSLGVSTFWWRTSLTAQPSGSNGPTGVQQEAKDVTAPVPVFGLFYDAAFSPRVHMRVLGEYFDATYSAQHGQLTDVLAGFDWYLARNFGLGAAYSWTRLKFQGKPEQANLVIDYRQSGAYGYLRFIF